LVIQKEKIQSAIDAHEALKKNLIAILLDIQAEYNYLPPESLRQVACALGLPLIDVIGVATFYRVFSLTPRGRHICLVCSGTACHVRGGPRIIEEFKRQLGVATGETTSDRQFTLETAACLGCCAIGPVVMIDGDFHGHVTIHDVHAILKRYRSQAKRPAPKARRSTPARSTAT
jgi:NADH:ubiquinone oxidoreductase subunit E